MRVTGLIGIAVLSLSVSGCVLVAMNDRNEPPVREGALADDARDTLTRRWKTWELATLDPQVQTCAAGRTEYPLFVRYDADGDAAEDVAAAVQTPEGTKLVVILNRSWKIDLHELDNLGTSAANGFLEVAPRGRRFVNPATRIDDYFSNPTLTATRCGVPVTAYRWTGVGFEKNRARPQVRIDYLRFRRPGASSTAVKSTGLPVRSRAHRSPVSRKRASAVRTVNVSGRARLDFLPAQRRRHAGVVAGARGVRGRERLPEDVLQVVDVDRAARPALLPSARPSRPSGASSRRSSRRSGRAAAPSRTSSSAAAGCRCAGRSRPDVFGTPGMCSRSSSSFTHRATSSTCVERGAVAGVEIDRDEIGMERIGDAGEPRILRDRGELRHVEQRRERSADQPIARAFFGDRLDVLRQHLAPDAGRHGFRVPLLVEFGRLSTPFGKRFITSGRSSTAGSRSGETSA